MGNQSELKDRIGLILQGYKFKSELANQLGISRNTVTKWSNGKVTDLRMDHLYKLADTTGFNPRWIALGEGDQKGSDRLTEDEQALLRRFRRLVASSQERILGQLAYENATQFTGDENRRKEFQYEISTNSEASNS